MNKLATKSMRSNGAKRKKIALRWRASIGTRLAQLRMSSSLGAGKAFKMKARRIISTKAKPPMTAGIQKQSIPRSFIKNNPKDLAKPELKAMLIPMMLARIPVSLRPSIKLKITPHIQPSNSPLKNKAQTL